MVHALKILPKHFKDIKDGVKTFEIRKNDRDFVEGDVLALNEWTPDTETYTGRFMFARINKIYHYPEYLKDGYIVIELGGFEGYSITHLFKNYNRTIKEAGNDD